MSMSYNSIECQVKSPRGSDQIKEILSWSVLKIPCMVFACSDEFVKIDFRNFAQLEKNQFIYKFMRCRV